MKKLRVGLLLFVFFFSFLVQGRAQFNTYHPFPDSNAVWRVTEYCPGPCWLGDVQVSTELDYYTSGDTILNGKKYAKVNISGGYKHAPCPPIDTVWQCYDSLYCLIRDDSATKKVYASFKPNFGIIDTLLYDYNIKIGDTLNTYISLKIDGNYVSSIDSILIGTTYRKQFIISNINYPDDSIIVGIGSAEGLLEWIAPQFECGSFQDCFTDSTIQFEYFQNAQCYLFTKGNCITVGVKNVASPELSVDVFPNPSRGLFSLQAKNEELRAMSIEVYNMLGEKVLKQILRSAQDDKVIDLTGQPNGIYLYRVVSENGELIGQGKLIIQK